MLLRNFLTHDFNPRSREGSDEHEYLFVAQEKLFQSTLPRRERHKLDDRFPVSEDISIHAPAKGATLSCSPVRSGEKISIHAPAKGATTYRSSHESGKRFQSTLPRRERPAAKYIFLMTIHFNPRSREGSDLKAPIKLTIF